MNRNVLKMTTPPRQPRYPVSPPIPVKPGPRSRPEKDKRRPVVNDFPQPIAPPSPFDVWYPWLWKITLGLVVLVVFIAGMEVGYRRASSRYQPLVEELSQAIKAAPDDRLTARPLPPPLKKDSVAVARSPVKSSAESTPPQPVAMAEPAAKSVVEFPKTPLPEKMVRFETHIQPIFQAKCVLCHGGKSTKSGLDLRTVVMTVKGGDGGPGVVPGNVESSLLWNSISDDRMPPGKTKLSSAEKRQIQQWILQGGS